MKDNTFLGTEKTGKLLFKLAVPAVTAQLVNLLYNLVDRIYIGHIAEIGTEALTGVGVCLPIIMLISAFAYLVGSGGAPRASIFMGSGDNDTAEKILGNCFTLLLGVSVVLTVVFYVWNEPLLMAFGASEKTVGYGVEYMAIYALGTIFVLMALGLNVFITAQGFTVVSMLSVVIGAVLNIALDPLFIFAFGMNVEGAALATIISQAVSCAFVVAFLSGRHSLLRLRWKNFLPRVKIFLPCLLLGLSPFIMQATESVITVCFNSSLQAAKGDIAVGAMTILSSIMMFCMMPLQGITQGAQPIVSYNYGARNADRVRKAFKLYRLLRVHRVALGGGADLPKNGGDGLFFGRGTYRLHRAGAPHLYGGILRVRRADRLPADFRCHRQGWHILLPRGAAEDIAAPAAHLYHARGFCGRPRDRHLRRRTRGGLPRRGDHGYLFYRAVRQGDEKTRQGTRGRAGGGRYGSGRKRLISRKSDKKKQMLIYSYMVS